MSVLVSSNFSQQFVRKVDFSNLQSELETVHGEISAGSVDISSAKHVSRLGDYSALNQRLSSLGSFLASNSIVEGRFEASSAALRGLDGLIGEFRTLLLSHRAGALNGDAASSGSRGLLEGVQSFLNTTYGGRYLFSGVDTNTPAVALGNGVESDGASAVISSFRDAFGSDGGVLSSGAVSAADLAAWLDTGFRRLFESPAWESLWSKTSGLTSDVRIDEGESISAGVSASEPAFRKLVMAFVMMSEVASENLSESARQVLSDRALQSLEEGSAGLTAIGARLGGMVQRLDERNQSITFRMELMQSHLYNIVEVDPVEASLRIEGIRSRLEASYALTARLNSLSLVNYL